MSAHAQAAVSPTVTLFGDRDALDTAVSDELGRRGCSTHQVTIPLGWLSSVAYAVVRVGTRSGRDALAGLVEQGDPRTRVVAVCETSDDLDAFAELLAMCRRCGEHHDIALIVHAPLDTTLAAITDLLAPSAAEGADDLARAIVDQMSLSPEDGAPPQFVERPYAPHHG
jgi:hypothetical protein